MKKQEQFPRGPGGDFSPILAPLPLQKTGFRVERLLKTACAHFSQLSEKYTKRVQKVTENGHPNIHQKGSQNPDLVSGTVFTTFWGQNGPQKCSRGILNRHAAVVAGPLS